VYKTSATDTIEARFKKLHANLLEQSFPAETFLPISK
jgi:hypothetical protein